MKKNSNIVLIGMPGTFKSSVGVFLAERTGRYFVDTDSLFEYFKGCAIAEYFEKYGEKEFRKTEEKIIARASEYENVVIATGGGAVLSARNMELLKNCGFVVWLKARPEIILERTKKDETRPLLSAGTDAEKLEKIQALLNEREPLYAKYADASADTDGLTPEMVAAEIVNAQHECLFC